MKILIIGKGGREHALAWKLSQNPKVSAIFVAPGNPGCELLAKVSNVKLTKINDLIEFAKSEQVKLTLVGSEELLVDGIVDQFAEHGLTIFGPDKKAAVLEGSKAFAKEFMNKYGIKTAAHKSFTEYADAIHYLSKVSYPIVIKASGLAAGKGVIIAQDNDEAEAALAAMLLEQAFGESGAEVVIEEFLVGVEASILSFTDCKTIVPLLSAKDHKQIGDNDSGPNTGGMGVIAPNPYVTPKVYQQFIDDILQPTLRGIQAEGMLFAGVIFFGLMITTKGVYLLEYNMRMGDPETQAILPLLESDLLEAIEAALSGNLANINLRWRENQASCCVVLASGGYPDDYTSGVVIDGIETFNVDNCCLFTAGVGQKNNRLVTAGGRVVNVVAVGDNLAVARARAYSALTQVKFKDSYCRSDIGKIRQ